MKVALTRLGGLVAHDFRQVWREVTFARNPPAEYTLNGVVLEVGPWVTDPIRNDIYRDYYEAPEHRVVSATLRADDVVLEIGSGMGYITTLAAGIAREVRSFDANPEIARVAAATVARNGRDAEVRNGVLARSPTAPSVTFYVGKHFTDASLSPKDGARPIEVPLLDFAHESDGCTYLIADIEGAEVELLSGDLPGIRAICVECHPAVASPQAITGMLRSLFDQGFALDLATSQGQVLYLARG